MDDLWTDLWTKQQTLYDYLQALNTVLLPDDRPNYAGAIGNAQYEIDRIGAILDLLDADKPILLPSDEQIHALQKSVGTLQQTIRHNRNVDALVAAATVVISTWPLSTGG